MSLKFIEVTKRYNNNVFGVKDLNFEVANGTFGLLGKNGAGKTTLMRILATIIKPTAGEIYIDDLQLSRNGNAIRSILGYLPQSFGVYPNLTAFEFLDYIACLKGISNRKIRKTEITQILEKVGLADVSTRKLHSYSGGMRQRVGIAQALLGNPRLIIVDEPTAGLDPEERVHFRNLLAELAKSKTIILSTHIISDIENICENLAILNNGSLLYNGPTSNLLNMVENKVKEAYISENDLDEFKSIHCIISTVYTSKGLKVRFISQDSYDSSGDLVDPTLEDAYLNIMGGLKR